MFLIKRLTLAGSCLLLSIAVFSQNFDIDLLRSINHRESNFKNNLFKTTSQSVVVFNIAAPVCVYTAGIIRHDKQLKKDAVYMLGALAFSSAVTHGMKRIIQRDRPYLTYPDIIQRDEVNGYSLPSGHTSSAFCIATSLSLLFPKWYVIVPSYLYATAVGYGRMYEGVHYPTDVLTGAIVGAGSAWLSFQVEKWIDQKHNNHHKPVPLPL